MQNEVMQMVVLLLLETCFTLQKSACMYHLALKANSKYMNQAHIASGMLKSLLVELRQARGLSLALQEFNLRLPSVKQYFSTQLSIM